MICLGWIVNSYYSRKHRFQISHTCSVVIIGWEWSVEYFCSRWGNICTSFQEEERFEHKFMVCAFFSAFINLSKHKHKIIKTSANSNTWAVTIVFLCNYLGNKANLLLLLYWFIFILFCFKYGLGLWGIRKVLAWRSQNLFLLYFIYFLK